MGRWGMGHGAFGAVSTPLPLYPSTLFLLSVKLIRCEKSVTSAKSATKSVAELPLQNVTNKEEKSIQENPPWYSTVLKLSRISSKT